VLADSRSPPARYSPSHQNASPSSRPIQHCSYREHGRRQGRVHWHQRPWPRVTIHQVHLPEVQGHQSPLCQELRYMRDDTRSKPVFRLCRGREKHVHGELFCGGVTLRLTCNSGFGSSRLATHLRQRPSLSGTILSDTNTRELILFPPRLNGGPGCSSMIGLFQGVYMHSVPRRNYSSSLENGPCQVNTDGKSTYLNPYR